jgi:hypothetical protein
MVYFQTKNPNLGKFWRALVWKMLIYFMDIWNISTDIWDSLWPFGTFYQEKPGKPTTRPSGVSQKLVGCHFKYEKTHSHQCLRCGQVYQF